MRKIINDAQNWFELDDTMIAVMCAVALFICPAGANEEKNDSLLEWGTPAKWHGVSYYYLVVVLRWLEH